MPMRRKKKSKHHDSSRDASPVAPNTSTDSADFYAGGRKERPLYEERKHHGKSEVAWETSRHKKAVGRREIRGIDPREKVALLAILRSMIMVLLLIITFFLLWKGLNLYEESRLQAELEAPKIPKTMVQQTVTLVEDFSISDQDAREKFAKRIERWQEADRMVSTAEALLQRNNYAQAIAQCQDALARDPSHRNALEYLAVLYFQEGDYTNAVNTYVRLMSVDPSDRKVQKELIHALAAYGDSKAVKYMATWFLDQNMYDPDVQRYLADALYAEKEYKEAVSAYDRVLGDAPDNKMALDHQADGYIKLEEYEKALDALEVLRRNDYRNPDYYKKIAICNAQLERGRDTVLILGQAAQLFGEKMVLGLIQNPQLDPVREDRTFQAFADRVGGEDFRVWLEKMAKNVQMGKQDKLDDVRLKLNVSGPKDKNILKVNK